MRAAALALLARAASVEGFRAMPGAPMRLPLRQAATGTRVLPRAATPPDPPEMPNMDGSGSFRTLVDYPCDMRRALPLNAPRGASTAPS